MGRLLATLLAHREDPDVDAGLFRLKLDIGSRQWGGTTWDLDLDIGRFDEDTGQHDGEISWDISRGSTSSAPAGRANAKHLQMKMTITEVVSDCPWQLTKTEVRVRVGGTYKAFDAALLGAGGQRRIPPTTRSAGTRPESPKPARYGVQRAPVHHAKRYGLDRRAGLHACNAAENNQVIPCALRVVGTPSISLGMTTKSSQGKSLRVTSLVGMSGSRPSNAAPKGRHHHDHTHTVGLVGNLTDDPELRFSNAGKP